MEKLERVLIMVGDSLYKVENVSPEPDGEGGWLLFIVAGKEV